MLGKRNAPNNDYLDEQSRRKYARVYCTIEDIANVINKNTPHDIDNPVPILTSYDSAVNDPIYETLWKEAANTELNQLAANNIFDVVEELLNVNIVTSRWVWNVKYIIG